MKQDLVIDMYGSNLEYLTPSEYLKVMKECPGEIARSEIIPPELGRLREDGRSDFGSIRVQWKTPRYSIKL